MARKRASSLPVASDRTQNRYLALLLATTAFVSVNPRPLQAQTRGASDNGTTPAPAASSNSSSNTQASENTDNSLEEVVVRGIARRYLPDKQSSATGIEMSLIDTPQAISVVTPEMLEISHSRTAYDVANMMPGIEQDGTGVGRESLLIRGQANRYKSRVDGIGNSNFSFPDGFALDRIEFVRGPATVIYGLESAFGGEVNSVLKQPLKDPRVEVGIEGGDFDRVRYQLDVTGPIPGTDGKLSARIVGAYTGYGSWVDPPGRHWNDRMIAGSLAYDPTSDLRVVLNYYTETRKYDPTTDGCTLVIGPTGALELPDKIATDHYYCGDPKHSFGQFTQQYFIGSLQYRLPNNWQFQANAALSKDDDRFTYMYPFGPAGAFGLPSDEVFLNTYDSFDDNQQLRFNVSLGGEFPIASRSVKFFAAYEHQDNPTNDRHAWLESLGVGNLNIYQGGLDILSDGSPIPDVDRSKLPVANDQRSREKADRLSLQLLATPIERLDVLAGFLYQQSDSSQFLIVPPGAPVEVKISRVVPRVGVTYQLTDGWRSMNDARAYFSYSEGFVPNVGVFGQQGESLTAPQQMHSYEVGVKSAFFNNAVNLIADAYHENVTNVPSLVFYPGGSYSALSGDRKFDGIEASLIGELLPGWNVAWSYTYAKTKIEDPSFPNLDLVVRSVPKNSVSAYSSYEFLRGGLRGLRVGGAIIHKGDYAFVDNSAATVARFGQLTASGYTRLDLNFSYAGFTNKWKGLELYLNVQNLNNTRYYYSRVGSPSYAIVQEPPRTITAGVRYVFDAHGKN
ncbi:MAG TPA: TonB-dependent receptor plug domain-containing protein [Steroidobacteraceae bacterium]|jgi:iron complex outermembrane receptor protein